jgi:hypothetical protein
MDELDGLTAIPWLSNNANGCAGALLVVESCELLLPLSFYCLLTRFPSAFLVPSQSILTSRLWICHTRLRINEAYARKSWNQQYGQMYLLSDIGFGRDGSTSKFLICKNTRSGAAVG